MSAVIDSVQWAPSGNALDGVPGTVMRLLASEDGRTFGYGYGPGWSVIFGSEQGDIKLEPGQWVARLADGSITVTNHDPNQAPEQGTRPAKHSG